MMNWTLEPLGSLGSLGSLVPLVPLVPSVVAVVGMRVACATMKSLLRLEYL